MVGANRVGRGKKGLFNISFKITTMKMELFKNLSKNKNCSIKIKSINQL
jgi:hypothetical protein